MTSQFITNSPKPASTALQFQCTLECTPMLKPHARSVKPLEPPIDEIRSTFCMNRALARYSNWIYSYKMCDRSSCYAFMAFISRSYELWRWLSDPNRRATAFQLIICAQLLFSRDIMCATMAEKARRDQSSCARTERFSSEFRFFFHIFFSRS